MQSFYEKQPPEVGYPIENYDFFNLFFLKTKNNYKIFNRSQKNSVSLSEKLKFVSPILSIPFGVETYLGKEVLNIELTNLKKDNKIYNFYNMLKTIDNFFEKLSWNYKIQKGIKSALPSDLLNLLKNKKYVSCIKNRPNNFDPLFRTHLKRNKKIMSSVFFKFEDNNKNKVIIATDELKGKKANFILELEFLWIKNDNYGLGWYVNAAKINED